MNRLIYIIMLLGSLCLGGCNMLEMSKNGELDGFWHLREIETLATGDIKDVKDERLYWAVQFNLLVFQNKGDGMEEYIWRFSQADGKLRINTPYVYDREDGDYELTDVSLIRRFGANALDVTYDIEVLNTDEMILNDGTVRIHLVRR